MKIFIALLAFGLVCQAIPDEEVLKQWKNFQEKFGRSYRSPVEHRHRFALFKQKLQEIEEHNKLYVEGKVSWYKGITPFSDWTSEEFTSYINKYEYQEYDGDQQTFKSENLTGPPPSVDWRDYGAVSEVKNQGACGSCWTFSSAGALEGAAKLFKGMTVSLSEQNLVDCATTDYGGHGCSGGTLIGAFQYVRYHGITTEENYPYTARQGDCKAVNPVLFATGFVRVATEDDLLKAVASIGPVSSSIVATQNLQDYSGGVLDDGLCASMKVNHGVLVIGYGSENGKDFWILKNSWGPSWGEGGYWKMIRGKNSCSVGSYASYPLV